MYTYKAFGLSIASEIVLTELLRDHSTEPDLIIQFGKVPDTFENIILQKCNKTIGKDRFRLDNQGIAKYFVEKGNRIIVEPYEGALVEEVKLYLLGSCMGAILHQRGILPLHGSCINIEGQGILLTGESGAGKSTITAALLNQGYRMLTDDVAAITWREGDTPVVYPSYPSQKLWEDAIERMDQKVQVTSLHRISNDIHKYSVANHKSFYKEPIVLTRIYEIIPSTTDELTIEEMKSTEKLQIIMKNSYRKLMIRGSGAEEWHFTYCTKMANRVLVYKIKRPESVHLEREIADRIMEQILKV